MKRLSGGATPISGRRTAFPVGVTSILMIAGAAYACAPGPEPGSPTVEGPPPVVLEQGPATQADEERASRLYQSAVEDFRWGRLSGVMAATGTIVTELPTTRVSGAALWLLARAEERSDRYDAALEAASRYAEALRPGDARLAEVRLVEARALNALGREPEATARVMAIPVDSREEIRAEALSVVRDAAAALGRDELADILSGTPLGQPLAAPLMLAYARALRLGGDAEGAREYAEAALAAGAQGPDESGANTLLADLGGGAAPGAANAPTVRIAALLSTTGPPTLQRYATLIEEGVRAALETSGVPENIELIVRDDAGDPARAGELIRALEAELVVGVVGPLLDDLLGGAAAARSTPLPLISPTAVDTRGDPGIFSLGALDPGSAETLARYAAASGLEYVVAIHPSEPNAAFQAEAFRNTFQELLGSVLRTLTYPPGTTHFEEVLRQAEALGPDALFFPIPAADVEALAPQVSFFGLDTLGVKVLGTSEWADPDVLRAVSPRHTNGVITAAPRSPGPASEAYQRFVRAYEERFQRSLRDPLAAAGYDAASLILLAVRTGARTPAEVRTALESIEGFEGATGVLSVEDGRIVREHHLLCIQNQQLTTVAPGERTVHYRPTRRGDPLENEPEVVPTGPLEIYCPGAVPEGISEGIR